MFQVFDQMPVHLADEVKVRKSEAFHEDTVFEDSEKKRVHEDRFCSQLDRFKYLLAFSGKQVVGGVTLLKRHTTFNGSPLLIGGIGGVWTQEKFENLGVASNLLKRSMKILEQNNCDIAYLCTDVSNPARLHLYGKFGFHPLRKVHTYSGKSGTKYEDTDGMIAPVNSPELYEAIMRGDATLDLGVGNW